MTKIKYQFFFSSNAPLQKCVYLMAKALLMFFHKLLIYRIMYTTQSVYKIICRYMFSGLTVQYSISYWCPLSWNNIIFCELKKNEVQLISESPTPCKCTLSLCLRDRSSTKHILATESTSQVCRLTLLSEMQLKTKI